MRAGGAALLALCASCAFGSAGAGAGPPSLRGLCAAGPDLAYASGTAPWILRARGGAWERLALPEFLHGRDFRDLQAWPDGRLLLMAAGPGSASGVWRRAAGSEAWEPVLDCPWPEGFFDGMAFWNEREGLLVGDPVDGALLILRTEDGGGSWKHLREAARAHAVPGEFAFAASGTSVCVQPGGLAWIGTGGAGAARVWRSADGGASWSVADSPLFQGLESAGIFSIAFADARRGVIVGGDYLRPESRERVAAWTEDGGRSWTLAAEAPGGYRSCVAAWDGGFVCTGPNGTDWSADGGRNWRRIAEGFHAVAPPYAAGSEGRTAVLERPDGAPR